MLDAVSNRRRLSISARLIDLIRQKPATADDLEKAALFTLDAAANILAGRNSVPGRKLLAWARRIAPQGDLSTLDSARQAFVLGGLCHILEVDDLHRASVVHPGCVVVPAVLSLAKGLEGKAALMAVLQGFEATCRVGMAVGPAHYKIWHNTATCGPFGSAMATASLFGLDHDQTTHAFGNAGSQSAGLWQFLDTGAETKHLHAGRAAEAGVVAGQLAAEDFSGAPEILEGERGFFAATCPDGDPGRVLEDADAPWQLHRTSIKPWPSCRHTHPAIDCALELNRRLEGCTDIETVDVKTYQAALDLCDRPAPDSLYAAKFSLQHCVAAALVDGHVKFDSFDDKAIARLDILRDRIVVAAAEPFQTAYPVRWGTSIDVRLATGEVVSAAREDAKGDPEAALSRGEMIEKAEGLLIHAGMDEPETIINSILDMAAGGPVPDIPALVGQV